MPYMIPPSAPTKSVLTMENIAFDELTFVREGYRKENESGLDLIVKASAKKTQDGKHRVTLQVIAKKVGEYMVQVKISAFCIVEEGYAHSKELIKKNAVAILFPYVRSELTLLTAQPDTDPIVLPPFNINAMIDNMQAESDDENSSDTKE